MLRRVSVFAAALVCALAASSPRPAFAQVPLDDVSTMPWTLTGRGVTVARRLDDVVYIGGDITASVRNSDLVGPAGVFDPASAELRAAEPELVGGVVLAAESDGAGGWILAGWFPVDGGARALVRIDASGRRVPWAPDVGAPFSVVALARSGRTLFLGGSFLSVAGQPRVNVAAIDIPTQQLLPWQPAIVETLTVQRRFIVQSLVVSGDDLYVSGDFGSVDGAARDGLARFDLRSGGGLSAWAPTARGRSRAVVAAGSTVVAGGDAGVGIYDAITGATIRTIDTPGYFRSRVGESGVFALTVSAGAVRIGGTFDTVEGQPRLGLAALDPATGALLPWAPMAEPSGIYALAASGDDVFVGGERFPSREGLALKVSATDGAVDANWQPRPGGIVNAVEIDASGVLVGGEMLGFRAERTVGVVGIDLLSGRQLPVPLLDARVRALDVDATHVVIGGDFTTAARQPRQAVAAFERSSGRLTGFAPPLTPPPSTGLGPEVSAVALMNGDAYFGGRFEPIGGLGPAGFAAAAVVDGSRVNVPPQMASVDFVEARGGRLWVNGSLNGAFTLAVLEAPPTLRPLAQSFVPGRLQYPWVYGRRLGAGPFPVLESVVRRVDAETGTLDGWAVPGGVYFVVGNSAVYTTTPDPSGPNRMDEFDAVTAQPTGWFRIGSRLAPIADIGSGLFVTEAVRPRNLALAAPSVDVGYLARRPQSGTPTALSDVGTLTQGTRVTVRWTPGMTGPLPTSYRLIVGSRPGAADLGTIDLPGTSRLFSADAPAGRYYLRVVLRVGATDGPPSDDMAAVVGVVGCAVAVPLGIAPVLTATSGAAPMLSWNRLSGVTIGSYQLRVGTAPGLGDLGTIALPASQTALSTAGAPAGTYHVAVVAVTACGVPLVSNDVRIDIATPGAPTAPTALTASVSGSTVSLSWTPSAGAVTGYVLEAGTAPGLANLISGLALGATPALVAPNVPAGTYRVRVRAANGALVSAPSNEIAVVVP